jgi:hypothetical protein
LVLNIESLPRAGYVAVAVDYVASTVFGYDILAVVAS